MADYGAQQGRNISRPPNFGPASSQQRDAAFSSIFGAAPPPGRSQTMNSQSPIPATERFSPMNLRSPSAPQGATSIRPPPPMHRPSPPQEPQPSNGVPARPMQQQPQPHHLPQPVNPDRRPYPPQRVDPRIPMPPQHQYANRPLPTRSYPNPSGAQPALNSNPYRTQSLASVPYSSTFSNNSGNYNAAPSFRQQPYSSHLARTTAQGRVVPERYDERTMSMSSLSREHEYNQTMSGRVIPNRRRESSPSQDGATSNSRYSVESYASTQPASSTQKTRQASQDALDSRAMSMASTAASERSSSMSQQQNSSVVKSPSSNPQSQRPIARGRPPLVYPALLSRVAEAFKDRIGLADREKDGLMYTNSFSGAEAVDLVAYIMQTTDRNLALLLGRSLDAQKFFHDVTYDHRLRDSQNEVYQFRETMLEDGVDVNGVFTLTTECYSPTCTPDRLCYSIACPKRVDQQKRLNMKPQSGLKRQDSRSSLHDEQRDEQKLWINTVSREIAESVSDREKKRQEVISEIMYTERDFVKDLEYLRDFWIRPLRHTNSQRPSPIPEVRREKFIWTVFSNCLEVYGVNSKFAEALTRRQQQEPIVRNVGDIFLEFVPRFGPFIKYGANQLRGKYDFEKEKQSNPMFQKFADETERLKESRKLELNGYLTKPTTRLARYPLLLENVLKYTEDDNPDKEDIPKAIKQIRETLSKVNLESGKAENQLTLLQLSQQLVWRNGEFVDLKLTDESRQMLFKGVLKKNPSENSGDVQAFLFDNALLFVRSKTVNKREELQVYRRPIPLGLLTITNSEEVIPRNIRQRPSSGLMTVSRTHTMTGPRADAPRQQGWPIIFKHLGKGGFEQTLYCTSQIQREKWIKAIDAQQKALRERSNFFTKTILSEGFFVSGMKVNCCVPIDGGRKLVVGTDNGVYIADRRPRDASYKPRRVLDVKSVAQVDVLEQHQILLVLYDKTLYSYSTEALDPEESLLAPSKRGRKIAGCNFFKVGNIMAQHLVCCVKTGASSNTVIKIYKPMDQMTNAKKKSGFSRMLAGGQEVLRPFKEFYIPTKDTYSVHFLRSTLCVGCGHGFDLVALDTLETQPLLDAADTSFDFVTSKESLKPLFVERLLRDFLLCYSDFSFFVDKNGWRSRHDWKIFWEGNPTAFARFDPYLLAFEPSFVEIRSLDTGALVYIITNKQVRMLHASNREILYAYEDEMGEDVIASLDFWSKEQNEKTS